MAQTIKNLIAPLIMMAVLALLPACWGLKRPSPVTVTIAEICAGNPFNASCNADYEVARIVKITECIAGGAAATLTCAEAVAANSCIRDPFVESCATNSSFTAYLTRARNERATYCAADNPNATLCAGVAGSVQLDIDCLNSPLDAPVYPSCSSRPNVVSICADAPFTSTGCGNIPNIEMLRIAHCEDSATAWDDGCVETTYTGAEAARNTACLTHGINVRAGGHADCAMRDNVLAACSETSPFAYDVCNSVGDIDMKRTTFCLKTTDNNGENPFNEGCTQDTHGDVNMARNTACLASLSADDGCEARITQTCTDTPLAGAGCSDIMGYTGFLNTFCAIGNNVEMMGCAMTPARLSACAAGTLGNECDTDAIAPKVCASSGPNANPFVAFCSSTNNISGGDIVAIRQTVVTNCLDGMSDDDNDVCQNTMMERGSLATGDMRCELAGHAFTDRCVYTEYEPARMGICTTRETAWNAGCTGGSHGNPTNARGQACVRFGRDTNAGGDSSCNSNTYADSFCKMSGTNPLDTTDNMGCRVLDDFPMISKAYCVAAPFTTNGCDGLNNFADIVGDYCDMNADQATCKVDSTAWTGSTFTSESPLIAVTAAASTDTTNRFLSGLTKGVAVPTITDFTALATTDTPVKANTTNHLALNDTEHGFGGEDDDGVMFFGGQRTDTSYRYYAGIYSSTNLGAPLTDVSQNGVWQAWMRTSGKDPKNEAFELTVNFDATTATGTLKAFFQSTGGGLYYNIDGAFKINGVITGNVAIGTAPADTFVESGDEYTLGVLTGLIGAEGVVAAFVSNTSTTTTDGGINPFVGGFVGIPAVASYAAFRNYYTLQTGTKQLHADLTTGGDVEFMAGSAGGLAVTDLTFDDTDQFTSFPVVDAGDGFALLFGETAGGDDRYRAGLLSGTDLGAPLVNAPSDGTWDGNVHVSRHVDGTTNEPLPVSVTLNVDFSTGRIGVTNHTITGSEMLTIAGEFRAGSNNPTLPVGILGGTVSYNDGTTEHTSLPLIGLIGVDGAIGVFHGGTDIPMVGGFAVKPTP